MTLDMSPVVPVVAQLSAAGFTFRLGPFDVVQIRPAGTVPTDAVVLFRDHSEDLRVIVGLMFGDDGLEVRVRRFQLQPMGPFTLLPDIEVRRGVCPACDQDTAPGYIGRCWRCRVAMQVVCGVPITSARLTPVASAA